MFYPSLDNSIDSIGTDVIWNQFGFRGEDTTIAILDTGVDFNHESLDDLDDNPDTDDPKIAVDSDGMLAFYNANTDKEYPDEQPHDSGSHGTHCAGIAAGTGGPSGSYAGVLVQDDHATVGTNRNNSTRIAYIMSFDNPLSISEDTSSFEMSFNTSTSVSIDWGAADSVTNAVKMGVDPFYVKYIAN